jgi:hypothetical protein
MKSFLITLLKIALVAFVLWWLLHNAPMLVMPLVGAFLAAVGVAFALSIAAVVGLSLGLVVVTVVLSVILALATALSPIWLPLLAVFGLIALCRSGSSRPNPSTG